VYADGRYENAIRMALIYQ